MESENGDVKNKYPHSILIGNTGFVGKNLLKSYSFSDSFHSTDVMKAYGTNPDLLVYAGVPGTKFLANQFPIEDIKRIEEAKKNIERIKPKLLILVSTIDIYDELCHDEDYIPSKSSFGSYGNNRLKLEKWIYENIRNFIIIRLPALYGIGLRKNFIYDLIHICPKMLNAEAYNRLIFWRDISSLFELKRDGYYHVKESLLNPNVRELFMDAPINALSFTDSRNIYQFYNLAWLWSDICFALKQNIQLLNISTPPIAANELYMKIYGKSFVNKIYEKPLKYDIRSKYGKRRGIENGYLYDRNFIMNDLVEYINSSRQT